ncbi:gamma-glutamyltranspeptidase/glutathione hydrolase [Winogradskyella epiphytica]|uniref:Glutathione hydrolase proenzyme n=1 Tax=Winogradskyella epiphytica TaxID=262005 RepID=A0A2V4XG13_9FLAO|nr:gamma-glutamyltransferase [Winogradskyella epiphytica]PYE81995.1 gamma-glutamyltranspeptidase/glutathione hydrolase [Winogradskyella epiphytica]GGW61237.1 gamma-glutamyltransferase [Winogradskyella epiphytica]
MKHLFTLLFLSTLCFTSCKENVTTPEPVANKRGIITQNAMVVSARKEASQIGSDILKMGGNAFDAMMATEMALAVTYPYAGNLGGGGFLVYRLADGTKGALDYREKAPLAATKNMYLDEDGEVIKNKSTIGSMAVGIPGTIAGIFEAQKRFGKLEVATILKPVIELAKNGYHITEKQEKRIASYDSLFKAVNGKTILYNNSLKAGDKISNKELASTLQRISDYGRDEFYKGETAKKLVKYFQAKGSIITMEDLAKYEAKWRDPVSFQYDNLTVTSMSPPSSGGICLNQIMTMIEPFNLKEYGHNSLKTIQVMVEAEKRAYADRGYYLGDPDFVEIPLETLTSDVYLQERMQNFSFKSPTPIDSISHGKIEGYESDETTHYSIVDSFGNAIAVTTTINGGYGSLLYVDELGFFLNNEMDDFSSKPGTPNYYGLIGAEANSIAPEKRMLSSMTPTILEKDGEFYMTLGTPGGSTIITSVLQTILNVHEFELTMQEAVSAPRFHNQWLPDEIRMEPNSFDRKLVDDLTALGYHVNESRSPIIGIVNGILMLEDGTLEGGADHRGDDTAVGF